MFYAVQNVRPHRDSTRVTVTWDNVAGSAAVLYHVFLDSIYTGKTTQRRFVFFGDGTHHVRIIGADLDDEVIDPADPDLVPSTPVVRVVINWIRLLDAGEADDDISRFDIYQGNRSGGAVDESEPRISIDVLTDADWNFTAVMDALKHGESRQFKVVAVRKDGSSDVAGTPSFLRSLNCHSPEMVVTSSNYDSGTAALTLTVAEITH